MYFCLLLLRHWEKKVSKLSTSQRPTEMALGYCNLKSVNCLYMVHDTIFFLYTLFYIMYYIIYIINITYNLII